MQYALYIMRPHSNIAKRHPFSKKKIIIIIMFTNLIY